MIQAQGPTLSNQETASWSHSSVAVLERLQSDPDTGLTTADATKRQRERGRNQLQVALPRSVVSIIFDQFKSMVIALLIGAAALAFAFSNVAEAVAILAVIIVNASIGFITELRAMRSMEALQSLVHVDTNVIRDGIVQQIPAIDLVVGDIVILDAGDMVTADIRLIAAAKLKANESTLTGESLPVNKHVDELPAGTAMMDRNNIVFSGTGITRGTGKGIVVGVGLNTELGRITQLAIQAEPQQTPLEKRLNVLGERLAIAAIVLAILIALGGVFVGRDVYLAVEVAVALAVAAIPEGLPIVATIALARGMWRMARRNALISKLSAVETLGATSVILTDKTGTLTENRMSVMAAWVAGVDSVIERESPTATLYVSRSDDPTSERTVDLVNELLTTGALCNNASLQMSTDGTEHAVGDATELALLTAAIHSNIRPQHLLQQMSRVNEYPFDPRTKLMATVHRSNSSIVFAVKGAPEAVISICSSTQTLQGEIALSDAERQAWLERASELGDQGLRTLALAKKVSTTETDDPYAGLTLLGIVGLEDPAREGVAAAIARCHDAGITVVMVTGDHLATARSIAGDVNIAAESSGANVYVDGSQLGTLLAQSQPGALEQTRVMARATPEQKLQLIDYYQNLGHVVAMTGDGVNDAPALKKADIGIAMGIRGTAVAKEASHMVLQDDEFGTIVEAVAQGRAIYENIRKFVVYLLSCNVGEVFIVGLATIAGAPLPLLPLQILFLNLVTDVFPALALGVGKGSVDLMKRSPRPAKESVLTKTHWTHIGLYGAAISATVLGAMAFAIHYLDFEVERAVTVSFCTLAFAQLWHVFNMRDNTQRFILNEITTNPWVWGAITLCVGLILMAIYLPILSEILALSNPGIEGWLIIVPMSFLPLIVKPFLPLGAKPSLRV